LPQRLAAKVSARCWRTLLKIALRRDERQTLSKPRFRGASKPFRRLSRTRCEKGGLVEWDHDPEINRCRRKLQIAPRFAGHPVFPSRIKSAKFVCQAEGPCLPNGSTPLPARLRKYNFLSDQLRRPKAATENTGFPIRSGMTNTPAHSVIPAKAGIHSATLKFPIHALMKYSNVVNIHKFVVSVHCAIRRIGIHFRKKCVLTSCNL